MAIVDYPSLQATVASYINRTDLSVVPPMNSPGYGLTTTPIQDAISLAENTIRLKVWRNRVRNTSFQIGNGDQTTDQFALPNDCAAITSLRLVSGYPNQDTSIRICTPEELADFRAAHYNVASRPRYAAVLTGNLVVVPVPDQVYDTDLWYWQELVPIGPGVVNPLFQEFPNLYLYATLLELAPYLEHDERMQTWQSKYDDLVAAIHARRDREEFGGPLPSIRLTTVF